MNSLPPKIAKATIASPDLETNGYHVVLAGHRLGPINGVGLVAYDLRPDTWVWHPGLPDWRRAEDVAELSDLLRVLPPPLPSAAATFQSEAANAFRRNYRCAIPFVAGIVLCYLGTGPLLSLLDLSGLRSAMLAWFVVEVPARVCGAGAAFFFARAIRLQLPPLWAIPSLVHPALALLSAVGLGAATLRCAKRLGLRLGFLGVRS